MAFFFQAILPAMAVDMVSLLPVPGVMTGVTPAFVPASLKGVRLMPGGDGLRLEFVLTKGQDAPGHALASENVDRLITYFLSALTLPSEQMWVNLSPYENDRIIPDQFGLTAMGRDLLAQDYILKQLTASLIYPDKDLGKKFWDEVYKRAHDKFGTHDIPVDTFNKVWIMPDKATVYENGMTGFIVKSRLKVMLDSDYLAMDKNGSRDISQDISKQIMREIIIPAIEKEVNEGAQFATLRQIYDAQVLAVWFKTALKASVLGQVYADQGKVKGIDVNTSDVNEAVYARYLQAFKQGVFNFVKEEKDPVTQDVLPRKYFSGGAVAVTARDLAMVHELPAVSLFDDAQLISVTLDRAETSTRNNYLWASDRRGLGRILEAMTETVAVPVAWDGADVKPVHPSDYFSAIFNRSDAFDEQFDYLDRMFANGLKGESNEDLFQAWQSVCPVDRLKNIQAMIDILALTDTPAAARTPALFSQVWQGVIDELRTSPPQNMKHVFIMFYEILRRWYKTDARPIALNKDYRRMVAVLSMVTMFSHGGKKAKAMDIQTILTQVATFLSVMDDLGIFEEGRTPAEAAKKKVLVAKWQKQAEILAGDYQDLANEVGGIERLFSHFDRDQFKDPVQGPWHLRHLLTSMNYGLDVKDEDDIAWLDAMLLSSEMDTFFGLKMGELPWDQRKDIEYAWNDLKYWEAQAGNADEEVKQRRKRFNRLAIETFFHDDFVQTYENMIHARIKDLKRAGTIMFEEVDFDGPVKPKDLLWSIENLSRIPVGDLTDVNKSPLDNLNALLKDTTFQHRVLERMAQGWIALLPGWSAQDIELQRPQALPFDTEELRYILTVYNRAPKVKKSCLGWLRHLRVFLRNVYQASQDDMGKIALDQPFFDQKDIEELRSNLKALVDIYIPALESNVRGENYIESKAERRVRSRPTDMLKLLEDGKATFRTKDGWGDYPGLTIEAAEGQDYSVTPPRHLVWMAIERMEENARSYLRDHVNDLGLSLDKMHTTYTLVRTQKGDTSWITLTMTNPGTIPERLLQADPRTGVQEILLWNPDRSNWNEGGTSMPFVYLALWNMGAKFHVKNDEGKVVFTIDLPAVDNAGVAQLPVTKDLGGIDLNEKHLTLDIEHHGAMIGEMAVVNELKDVGGFKPVVVNISPIKDLAGYLILK
jgi:hypothetical protein